MKLPVIPADKANHLIYGAGIALVVQAIVLWLVQHHGLHLPIGMRPGDIGLGAAAAFGAGKEAIDRLLNLRAVRAGRKPPHGVDPLDALATLAGGFAIWSAQP